MNVREADIAGARCIIEGLVSTKDNDATRQLAEVEAMLIRLGATVVGRVIQRSGVSRTKKPGGFSKTNSPTTRLRLLASAKRRNLPP